MAFTGSIDLSFLDDEGLDADIGSVEQCVRQSVRRYLKAMGDHDPDDLYRYVISEVEKPLLEEVLRWTNGNRSRSSAILGVSRNTLNKKIQRHKV